MSHVGVATFQRRSGRSRGYATLPLDSGQQQLTSLLQYNLPAPMCPQLVNDMAGARNTLASAPNALSPFLSNLSASWSPAAYGNYWLAATGRFCSNQMRFNQLNPGSPTYTGCLESSGANSNDGVVCADSAEYSYFSTPTPSGAPTSVFDDPGGNYSHTNSLFGFGTGLMMGCVTGSSQRLLDDPPTTGDPLFQQLAAVINAH